MNSLQQRIGYAFRNGQLLTEALTHPSFQPESGAPVSSNQRLEFLGDAVLQLILTEELFRLRPEDREGQLSKRRSALSKGAFLARLARQLGLDAALRMSASEAAGGGRNRTAALEDAFEALVGAVYLDSDFLTARQTVLGWYGDLAQRFAEVERMENPKGRLQELVQPVLGNDALKYQVIAIRGEDHARSYEVEVSLHGRRLGQGQGSSKKIAEEAAAAAALAAHAAGEFSLG